MPTQEPKEHTTPLKVTGYKTCSLGGDYPHGLVVYLVHC